MFTRLITPPDRSFFLFGPRATGKTTWISSTFPNAQWYNLLKSEEFLRLSRAPELLRKEVEHTPKDSWIVIDEVQRIPELLNEVHDLLSREKRNFILSGSSARKLKRGGANLLAGRASTRDFFPLTTTELGNSFSLDHALRFGMLPDIWNEPLHSVDILTAYADTYIREEILQQGLIKNLHSFSRFLEIAALVHGQVMNVSSIAKDAQVARQTVQGYFDILVDTLIGFRLPAFRPKLKVRESGNDKFYLFDPGVVRALSRRLRDTVAAPERGFLFETLILNELRAYNSYRNRGLEFSYWRSGAKEVDFIIRDGNSYTSIEVKSGERWRSEYTAPSLDLLTQGVVNKAFGVYCGERAFNDRGLEVLPYVQFCKQLFAGELLF